MRKTNLHAIALAAAFVIASLTAISAVVAFPVGDVQPFFCERPA